MVCATGRLPVSPLENAQIMRRPKAARQNFSTHGRNSTSQVQALRGCRNAGLPVPREIIVVNDGSTDGTAAVLDGVTPVDGVLSIVHATFPAHERGKVFGLFGAATCLIVQGDETPLTPGRHGCLQVPGGYAESRPMERHR